MLKSAKSKYVELAQNETTWYPGAHAEPGKQFLIAGISVKYDNSAKMTVGAGGDCLWGALTHVYQGDRYVPWVDGPEIWDGTYRAVMHGKAASDESMIGYGIGPSRVVARFMVILERIA